MVKLEQICLFFAKALQKNAKKVCCYDPVYIFIPAVADTQWTRYSGDLPAGAGDFGGALHFLCKGSGV